MPVGGVSIVNKNAPKGEGDLHGIALPGPHVLLGRTESCSTWPQKYLGSIFFPSSWPFPLTFYFMSLLSFHLAFLFAATSCHTYFLRGLLCFRHFTFFLSLCFKLLGQGCHLQCCIKRQISVVAHNVVLSCLYICLHFVTFFLSPSFLCLFSP